MTFDGRHHVASEASVSGSIQAERLKTPLRTDCWLPSGCVDIILAGWKTLKGKNSRKWMLSLGPAVARDDLITLAKFHTFLDNDEETCIH